MGIVSKLVSKAVTKAAPKVALSLSEQASEEAVSAAPAKMPLVTPKTASKATKSIKATSAADELPREVEMSIPLSESSQKMAEASDEVVLSLSEQLAKKEGIASQTEEALPTPAATESPYNFPNKAFSDDQYAEAEKALEDSFLMPSAYTKLKKNPEKFANELQKKAITLFGDKTNQYDMPFDVQSKAKNIDEVVAEVEEAKAQKPKADITGEEDVIPAEPIDNKKSIFSGKLGTSQGAQSNQILEEIRQLREQNYKELSSMPQAQRFDEPVLDVALGEFRYKYGQEYDPVIRSDNRRIIKLMEEKQKEYDRLKKKYADTPDITLYHGGSTEKIASIEADGFRRPSLSKRTAQQELRTGSTSMTTDIALNFNPATGFGGTAENILEKKIPYADYIFTRVNMKPSEYKDKDLDATARTITGSPTGTRALRLPRTSGFYETESAYIESDKMKMGKNVDEIAPKGKQYEEILTAKRKLQDKLNDEAAVYPVYKEFDKTSATRAYSLVRDYLNNSAKLGRISNVRSGIGESYEYDMTSLFYRSDYLKGLRDALQKFGMSEKADNMGRLVAIAERGLRAGTDSKVGNDLLNITDKFNKGGLVRRK
jgi:hypothetical protein